MTELRLLTLGGVRVLVDNTDITTELPIKLTALLVYLARNKHPKPREHLAEMLWSNKTAQQAYGSLRTALSKAKPLLGDCLHISHHEIGVQAWLDANHFDAFLQAPTVSEALSLYHGDFMASFFINDAIEFEAWQLRESEKLHETFMQASLHHAQGLHKQSRLSDAILVARRAVTLSPLREDIQRLLIQLYHANGDRASALRQYESYRRVLWEELGLEPDETIEELYQQLEKAPIASSTLTVTAHPSRHTLPARLTSFVGRADNLYQLNNLIRNHPLITITATGGAGKTRLAIEMGYRLKENYTDGVCFVDLSEVPSADHVLPAIAGALGLPDSPDQQKQISAYLEQRQMMLILDNFEHVLDATAHLSEWMRQAPRISWIITSREPLKLYGEQVYHLQPLTLQDSCQLFYERLRAIHNDFQRTENADTHIKAICQRLEGLPLAIELATTRARMMSLEAILNGLNRSLALLESDLRDMPRRQRTIFSTIEWSYSLLTPQQARLLRQLSVFRGGWTQEAAQAVSEDAHELPALIDKNLVRRVFGNTQRFAMLEPIREFASCQLEREGNLNATLDAIAQWILAFAQDAMYRLRTSEQSKVTASLRQEEENIRMILDYLMTQPQHLEMYARIIGAFGWSWNFLRVYNLPFQHAKHIVSQNPDLSPEVRAHLLVSGGHGANALGYNDLASQWQEEALQIFEALGDTTHANHTRFFMTGRMVNVEDGIKLLMGVRRSAMQEEDEFLLAMTNINLGAQLSDRGEFEKSKMILQEGMDVCEHNNYWLFIPFYYNNLGCTYYAIGDIPQAFKLLEYAYAVSVSENNMLTEGYSLLDLCELCYLSGRMEDLANYIRLAESVVKELGFPTLYMRFYFWRAILATYHQETATFYTSYNQIFRYMRANDTNATNYIINATLYLVYLFTQQDKFMEDCAILLGALDAYIESLHFTYRHFQIAWREQILQAFDNRFEQQQQYGKSLDIATMLKKEQELLDAFLL